MDPITCTYPLPRIIDDWTKDMSLEELDFGIGIEMEINDLYSRMHPHLVSNFNSHFLLIFKFYYKFGFNFDDESTV